MGTEKERLIKKADLNVAYKDINLETLMKNNVVVRKKEIQGKDIIYDVPEL